MAINLLRGRGAAATEPGRHPIGEVDQQITSCPTCARPLVVGTRRCSGCRTRLILDVQLSKASVFVLAGALAGTVVGGSVTALVTARHPAAAVPAASVAPVPIVSTGPGTGASAQPGSDPAASGPIAPAPAIPAPSLTALRQTVELNARLVTGAAALEAELAAGSLNTVAIARALRTVAADTVAGLDAAPRIDRWSAAGDLGARLARLYEDAGAVARQGLGASLSNGSAYRAAAGRMIAVLGGIAALDAESRALASTAGITLPPVRSP